MLRPYMGSLSELGSLGLVCGLARWGWRAEGDGAGLVVVGFLGHGREGAEEEVADVGEDGGSARGDAVLEGGEFADEGAGEFFGFALLFEGAEVGVAQV